MTRSFTDWLRTLVPVLVLLVLAVPALLLGAAGCAVQAGSAPGPSGPAAGQVAAPILRIPSIGVRSTLIPLGLNADGTVEVPSLDEPMQAGWYRYGPTPGDVGPAVVLGHVNARGSPGVFARLDELAVGDAVSVERDQGHRIDFVVTRVEQVSKTRFPTARVYGDTPAPELRLVTCGGELDRARHRYLDSVIVYAVRAQAR